MNKLLVALLGILLAAPAFADVGRGWGHGGGWGRGGGWGWGGDWIVPALVGGAIVYGLTQPQTVYVQQPVPVYAPNVAPPAVQYWYFCAAANAYYPYVSSCPSGWQTVPATPYYPDNAPAQ